MKKHYVNSKKFLFVFIIILISNFTLHAENLIVSGIATPSGANGTYVPNGTINGKDSWVHENGGFYVYYAIYDATTSYWYIDYDTNDDEYSLFYDCEAEETDKPYDTGGSHIMDYCEENGTFNSGVDTYSIIQEEAATPVPEISVSGSGTNITDGDTTPSFNDDTKFGSVNTSSTLVHTFTITNSGTANLEITSVVLSGTDANQFSKTNPSSLTVAASGSTTFTVTFDPSSVGTKIATVTINNNDSDEGTFNFNINGYGFIPEDLVVSGITGTYVAANTGYVHQGVYENYEYWKSANGYYIYSYNNIWCIDNNQSNTATLFDAHDHVDDPSVLEVNSWDLDIGAGTPLLAAADPKANINVTGSGENIALGETTPMFSEDTKFGSVNISSGSRARTYTIQNTGGDTLTLSGSSPFVTLGGTNSSDFSVTTPPASVIAEYSSTTFVVTFNPSTEGSKSATISIPNNDVDENPYTFTIQGDGFTPKNLDVSDITTPSAANGRYNHQGILNEFQYWKHETLNYFIYNDHDGSDRYWNIDTNTDDSAINFYSNNNSENASPVNVTSWIVVSGSAGTPKVEYSGPEILVKGNGNEIIDNDVSPSTTDDTDFGETDIASGTITKTFTIQNTGGEALSISGIALSFGAHFSITTSPLPTAVAAGGSATFNVQFNPSSIGVLPDTITINNNDANESTYNFLIQGTGLNSAPIATAPGTPTVTEDETNVALADNIQVTDADGENQTVTFTITGGTVTLGTSGISFGGSGNGSASFTAAGTLATINTALDAATFTPTPNLSGTGAGTIAFVSNDGTDNSNTATVSFDITAVNDEPSLTATGASPTFTEDGAAAVLFTNAAASTVESGQTLDSLILTVTNVNDGADEILNIDGSDVTLTNGTTVGSTSTNSMRVVVGVSGTDATVTITKTAGISASLMQTLINAITYRNTNNTPNTSNRVVTITVIRDNGGTANGGDDTAALSIVSTVTVVAHNDAPTLTTFATDVDTTTQNTEVEITLAELKAQGNEADVDGTVDTFVVNVVSTGTLKIGASSGTATSFNASTNKKIDATNKAYWTPAASVFGTQNAFTTTVLDNNGAESTGAVQATVQVNDVTNPEISGITISGSPAATATSITFVVAFTEAVVNVSTNDFTMTKTGTANGTIASVSASAGTSINVTVNSITGTGTLRLDLNAATNIADASANTPPAAFATGSVHSVDRDNPTLSSSVPVDDATGISAAANIALTFSENIVFGTGNIQIIDLDDNSSTVTIDAASPGALASISTNTLTLNPSSSLEDNTNYVVQIAATAIDDSNGNSYAGILDNTTLNFRTAPTVAFTSTSSNGLESVSSADLRVDLSSTSGLAITVDYAVTGTATGSGTDFTLANGTLTIAANAASDTITIAGIVDDALFEDNETVIVTLSNPGNASLGTNTVHTYTITDNDTVTVGLSASDAIATEGGADDGEFTATITKVNNTGSTINIPVTMSGEATNGTDYTSITQIPILNGSATGTVAVAVTQDALFENTETVIATLGSLSAVDRVNAGTPNNATVTINDEGADAVTVGLTASDDAATEGGADDGEFTATLSSVNNTGSTITIPVTMSGQAIDGTDYASITQITVANGSATGTVAVDVTQDGLFENTETVIAALGDLSAVTGVSAGTPTNDTVTIADDSSDAVTVGLSATDDTATEGGADDGEFTATLTSTNNTGSTINIPVTMSGEATNGTDYTSITQISIANGATNGTVTVEVTQDVLFENTETAIATLGNLTGVAGVSAGTPTKDTVTISDDSSDDVTVGLSASDASATEGGTDDGEFTATLTCANNTGSIINIPVTMSGQATEGTDYTSITQISVANGSATGTVAVDVTDDALFENTETVIATLGSLTGIVGVSSGTPTKDTVIISDDAADAVTVGLSATDATAAEGGSDDGEFTATISSTNNTGSAIIIPITMSGIAANGVDYASVSQISIANSTTSGTVAIDVAEDVLFEVTETAIASLGNLSGVSGVLAGAVNTDTVTISDNDPKPTVTFTSAGQSSNDESGTLTITAVLSAFCGADVIVPFTINGLSTATGGGVDYTIDASPLTIDEGDLSDGIIVTIVSETVVEPDETVIVKMGTPTNATQGAITTHIATIADDDGPPIAVNDSAVTNEDSSVTFNPIDNDSDPNGNLDTTSVTILDSTNNGLLVLAQATGEIVYTPTLNYNGSDSLYYSISNTHGLKDTAKVFIAITPVNDKPIATNDNLSIAEDNLLTFNPLVNDFDVDNNIDSSIVVILDSTTNGNLVLTQATGQITYTPILNYFGSDTMQYSMGDLDGLKDTAMVYITITPVDDPPIAVDDIHSVAEDTPLVFNPLGNDWDGDNNIDTTSVTILDSTKFGGLSLVSATGIITYSPQLNYFGNDTIRYKMSDLDGNSDTAFVYITVTPVNDAPVAVNDSILTWENSDAQIDVLANDSDVDLDGLRLFVTSPPVSGGVAIVASNKINYSPPAGFFGTDVFEYQICDNGLAPIKCATANVYVTVNPINDLLVVDHEHIITDEDISYTGDLTDAGDYDPDGTELLATTTPLVAPTNGTITVVSNGEYIYTPNPNFSGTDLAVVQICDQGIPGTTCKPDSIFITINPVNDAPFAIPLSVTIPEDTTTVLIDFFGNVSDVDSDNLTTGIISGNAILSSVFELSYTPATNFNGTEIITYSVCDDLGACSTGIVDITVAPVNDPPVLVESIKKVKVYVETIDTILLDGVFFDPDTDDILTYNITLEGGQPLPDWIVYNATDNSIVCSPNQLVHVGKYNLIVTVTDNGGAQATDTFKLQVKYNHKLSGYIFFNYDGGEKSGVITQGGNAGEPAVGVLVELREMEVLIDSTRTNNEGFYLFEDLPAAICHVFVKYQEFVQEVDCQINLSHENRNVEGINFTIWPEKSIITDIDLMANKLEVQLFPNPTSGKINLHFSDKPKEKIGIKVYSITGDMVLNKEFEPQELISFSLSDFVSGIYIVRLNIGSTIVHKEIILDKNKY